MPYQPSRAPLTTPQLAFPCSEPHVHSHNSLSSCPSPLSSLATTAITSPYHALQTLTTSICLPHSPRGQLIHPVRSSRPRYRSLVPAAPSPHPNSPSWGRINNHKLSSHATNADWLLLVRASMHAHRKHDFLAHHVSTRLATCSSTSVPACLSYLTHRTSPPHLASTHGPDIIARLPTGPRPLPA